MLHNSTLLDPVRDNLGSGMTDALIVLFVGAVIVLIIVGVARGK